VEAIFNASKSSQSVASTDSFGISNNDIGSNESNVESTNLNNESNLIIDARPLANALAQTAMGAGTEVQENYKNSKLVFLGIENIHVVRESFQKLYEGIFILFFYSFCVDSNRLVCCNTIGPVEMCLLNKSGWLKHIKTILKGVLLIVKTIDQNNVNALIHCR
jgi:hypothetical protein